MGSDDFYGFMKDMLSTKFFTEICTFSREEREQREDWIVLTKGMLLLDVHSNARWDGEELSDEALIKYIIWAREHYDDFQKNTLRSVIEYLEEAFVDTKERLRKEMIPYLICKAGRAMFDEINPTFFQIV